MGRHLSPIVWKLSLRPAQPPEQVRDHLSPVAILGRYFGAIAVVAFVPGKSSYSQQHRQAWFLVHSPLRLEAAVRGWKGSRPGVGSLASLLRDVRWG